ncbi:hypothetical protein HMPREF9969_2368 [Prevotella sp. oral taxon 306 str. F0472]|uniref:hypothetical protein n=1 Tax=Prevotella sp. oral taxon 306 TaxID=712461 RepID=UPI00025B9E35|nr:hypothetical protein [Prevotella sp. oral taxon 306]EID34519.1 hypothetical protein HMPREF9969_2368 [Prevotella sp. oral taxon 306 str. F0472]
MMRTKQLFKTRLLSFAALCSMALAAVSCANEDVAQNGTDTGSNDNDKNMTTFVAGNPTKTRTTMDYNSGDFYWEAGDKIYVQDDDGAWKVSSNAPTSKTSYFKFKVSGKFNNSATYKVYYPGKNGSNNQLTIPTAQTQTTPSTTDHFGTSGDCGTADATGTVGGKSFSFQLEHQAAILVFEPFTKNAVFKNCYLTKVEVTADNNIAGNYTLDPSNGEITGAGSDKQIILTTKGSGTYADGFKLDNSTSSTTADKIYMFIKPGTHKLKIRYWLKDPVTSKEGTITKVPGSFTYDKNTYYDMTADLDIRAYDGDHYYMWDAQDQYWKGYEWTKNLGAGVGQPTFLGQPAGNYAQSNTDSRWYHEGSSSPFNATQSCATLPNANELSWYCKYGDPRWDEDELWTTMGHLYKGGMWFKKKSVLQADHHYDTEKSADGSTDMRTTFKGYNNFSSSITDSGLPSAADAGKYFYLPALSNYVTGQLMSVGDFGYFGGYWSSSAEPWDSNTAYCLTFMSNRVKVGFGDRFSGFRVGGFE